MGMRDIHLQNGVISILAIISRLNSTTLGITTWYYRREYGLWRNIPIWKAARHVKLRTRFLMMQREEKGGERERESKDLCPLFPRHGFWKYYLVKEVITTKMS